MTVAFHMAIRLAVVAAEGFGVEGPYLVGAPHAQVDHSGEGPSRRYFDLSCGVVAAVSGGDGAAAGEGDGRVFGQRVERVAYRISHHDALPPLLDRSDGSRGLSSQSSQREGGVLVQRLQVQGSGPHNDSKLESGVPLLKRASSKERC